MTDCLARNSKVDCKVNSQLGHNTLVEVGVDAPKHETGGVVAVLKLLRDFPTHHPAAQLDIMSSPHEFNMVKHGPPIQKS